MACLHARGSDPRAVWAGWPGWLLAFLALGCTRSTIPDPQDAVDAYADAARRGDAAAIHALLTEESQRTFGEEGTRRLVADSKAELAAQGKALADENAKIEAGASVRFIDGERADLVVEAGHYKVESAAVLPAGARTPSEALAELRQALARRSYASLLRVLTEESRGAVEQDLESLVVGLEEPDTLDVKVNGDEAEVSLPGGHVVELKREAGVWKVADFR